MRTVLAQREAAGKILITSTRRPPAGRLVLASALLLGLAGWLLGDVSAATPAPRPVAGTPAPPAVATAPAPLPSTAAPADHVHRMRHHACRAAAASRCSSAAHHHRRPQNRRHANPRHENRRHPDQRPHRHADRWGQARRR